MRIQMTDHERAIIIQALVTVGTVITMHLAEKINRQDPADDGAEVAILKINRDGWDQ
jgi:hypothetical protein